MESEQQAPEFTQSIVSEHLDEVAFLWGQLQNAAASSLFTLSDYRRLENRLIGRLEALRVYGKNAVGMCLPALATAQRGELFAAARVVLEVGGADDTARIAAKFGEAAPEPRPALVAAIAQGAPEAFIKRLLTRNGAKAPAALMELATVAALRLPVEFGAVFPAACLRDGEPEVRRAAWTTLRLNARSARPEQTLAGALDDDPQVRRQALETAAWAGQPWVLEHCRRAAAKPGVEHGAELWLLAVLATESDAAVIQGLGARQELGAIRYQVLGTHGRAAVVPALIAGMTQRDPLAAAAAGAAFTRITGRVLRTVGKATLPPEDGSVPDAFEKEFLEEVALPDAREAADYWEGNRGSYEPDRKYSQGMPVPETPPFDEGLDVVSIREACLRAAFAGKPGPRAADFERLPLVL